MHKKSFTKSWIVIDHPQQLAIAIWVSRSLKKEFGQNSNLVISRHAYWKGIKFSEYRKEFSKVKWFERLDYPLPSFSLYLQFVVSLLLIPKFYKLSKFVKNLGIGKGDIIIGLSTQQFLENKILRFYSETKRIGVVPMAVYRNSRKRFLWETHKYSLGSFIVKRLQYIFRMHEVICIYRKRIGPKRDGDTIQRYKKPISKIYDFLLVMENSGTNFSNRTRAKIIRTRYPYTLNLGNVKKSARKMVIFLGEAPFLTSNLDSKIKIELMNKCLGFLRKNYGRKYELIYKPHPRSDSELKVLDLREFIIYKGHDPAEIFFIKNRSNIHAVFSVSSTSSRSALNCGLPSYVFYKIFPFEPSVEKDWVNLLGKMPNNSVIVNFDQKPKEIKMGNWEKNHIIFENHLTAIIKRINGVISFE